MNIPGNQFFTHLRSIFFRLVHRKNSRISVGKNLQLHCWLSIKGPGKVVIGDDCVVRALPAHPAYMVTLYTTRSDAVIDIGNAVCLVSARFSCKFNITIGDNVVIEDASIMDTDFHSLDISRQSPDDETKETCRVVIHRNVRVGSRAIITKGVVLEEGVHVYPGAIVQKSFAANAVVIGNPARVYHLD